MKRKMTERMFRRAAWRMPAEESGANLSPVASALPASQQG
jgi:hypothetical protein